MAFIWTTINGLFQPTPEPESPKQSPLLDEPKRQINWSAETRDKLLDDIKSFKPEAESVQAAKILMLGHIGSGKSSFVNSINTVFAGRLRQDAKVGIGAGSFTLKFRFWNIKAVQGKALPVQLCDTMGLEDSDKNGISEEDLMSTIMGHVQKDYLYNPIQSIQMNDPKYTPDPLLGDRVHCVVYLINCCQISVLTEEMLNKYKNLRRRISNKEIPQVAILTHCDEACPEVKKDLTNIFKSRNINENMNEASQKLGIALNCVFPVVNYSTQVDTTTNMDVLMLSTFKHVINYAGDFISENKNSD